jgi:RNA polymerase sporulation-specific sigma factor
MSSSERALARPTGRGAPRETSEIPLILAARSGDERAMDAIIRRYEGFVRLKASSYFLAGGDANDLIQEGLVGLYKAVRDFRPEKEASFRSFAELCITRQIITAIKTATRFKHVPLNSYVSFSHTPAGQEAELECTLGDAIPGPSTEDPASCVISSEELRSLLGCLGSTLSRLESQVLTLYLEGRSYERIGQIVGCEPKTVDNALQRVKRKVLAHLASRRLPS